MVKRIKQIFMVCSLAGAAIMAAWLAAPASAIAGGPQSTITLDVAFVGDPPPTPTFTTTGDVLCPAGTATQVPESFRVVGGNHTSTFHLKYMFTCDDGSGTFTIRVQASGRICEPTDSGGWAVVGGTGAYEDLHGGGNLVGTLTPPDDPCNATGIIDVYTGVVMK